eukprot:2938853-Pyramimonas_sp.AAC.3
MREPPHCSLPICRLPTRPNTSSANKQKVAHHDNVIFSDKLLDFLRRDHILRGGTGLLGEVAHDAVSHAGTGVIRGLRVSTPCYNQPRDCKRQHWTSLRQGCMCDLSSPASEVASTPVTHRQGECTWTSLGKDNCEPKGASAARKDLPDVAT